MEFSGSGIEMIMKKVNNCFRLMIVVGICNIVLISFLAASLYTSVGTLAAFIGDYNIYRNGVTKIEQSVSQLATFVQSQHQDALRKIYAEKKAIEAGESNAPVEEKIKDN